MPITHCISTYQIEVIQKERREKRSNAAKKKAKKYEDKGSWSHLKGKQITIHGVLKAPPYPAGENQGQIAIGMDGKRWESRAKVKGMSKGQYAWVHV